MKGISSISESRKYVYFSVGHIFSACLCVLLFSSHAIFPKRLGGEFAESLSVKSMFSIPTLTALWKKRVCSYCKKGLYPVPLRRSLRFTHTLPLCLFWVKQTPFQCFLKVWASNMFFPDSRRAHFSSTKSLSLDYPPLIHLPVHVYLTVCFLSSRSKKKTTLVIKEAQTEGGHYCCIHNIIPAVRVLIYFMK